jgi:hypothetical protein
MMRYDLVGAASIVLDTSTHNILVVFGEFWMDFIVDLVAPTKN